MAEMLTPSQIKDITLMQLAWMVKRFGNSTSNFFGIENRVEIKIDDNSRTITCISITRLSDEDWEKFKRYLETV